MNKEKQNSGIKSIIRSIPERIAHILSSDTRNTQLALYVIIIILLNVVSAGVNFRIDLTRNNTYSLSQKSIDVVSHLKENLKLRILFSSKDLPAQHIAVYRYLKDLLEEYNYYGNEYFSYEFVPDDSLEKEARDYGIQPVQSQEYVNDQIKVRQTYMGLVIQQADLLEKINAITSTKGLEFSITSLIQKMSSKVDGLLGLKNPISVQLYLDSRLRALGIVGLSDLEKKVQEAVDASNKHNYNKLKFKAIDPSKDKKTADMAKAYGLDTITWKGGAARNGRFIKAGEGVLGIVMKSDKNVHAFNLQIAPTLMGSYAVVGVDKLTERINKGVDNLISSNPEIGYITGHGEVDINDQRSGEGGGVMMKLLSDIYRIKPIDLTKGNIPEDLNCIIVDAPRKELQEYELYKIDQFLMRGKSVIFFVDSFNEISPGGRQNMFNRQRPMVLPVRTGLEAFFKHFGFSINKDIVLDSNCAKTNMGQMIKDFPAAPIIKQDGMSRENVITRYLNGVLFNKVSSITLFDKQLKKAGIRAVKLINSSNESWLMQGRINFNPFFMNPPQEENMSSYSLAVLLEGPMESFFKGKEKPKNPEKKKGAEDIKTVERRDKTLKDRPGRILAVASSHITRSGLLMESRRILASLSPQKQNENVYSNSILLHNMVDYCTGNTYVPEMRSKSLDYNPIEKKSNKTRIVLKAVNMGGVPFLVILFGILIWRMRLSRKKQIMAEFSGEVKDE